MELSFNEVYKELESSKVVTIENKKIQEYFNDVSFKTVKITNCLTDKLITGYENINGMGSESNGIRGNQGTNPMIWELGHISHFYDYHCLRYLFNRKELLIKDGYIYDSFITDREMRYLYKKNDKEKIFNYYFNIMKFVKSYLKHNTLDSKKTYLLMLVILHNHMHCESLLFTSKLLGLNNVFYKNYIFNDLNIESNWIRVKGGHFNQGTYEGEFNISFDNEMPAFKKNIFDFEVMDTLVTEKQLLEFIKDNGYENKMLWSVNGWNWKLKNNIKLPMYWFIYKKKYYIKDFNIFRRVINSNPACHISWYEAEAISKWLGGRLPTESEWEYMATNGGESKYPWGDKWIEDVANLDYSGDIVNVRDYDRGKNRFGVLQLIGNVWEWCQEPIYPYNGFKIDPVYREFSYPFFGFKRILKGGCWAVPKILINPKYRNAQMPDMRMQFTGVRVVRDVLTIGKIVKNNRISF